MEYNINSVGIQYNNFVNYNQPFYNLVSNPCNISQTPYMASNQSFVESVFPSIVQSNCQQRGLYLRRQHFTTSLPSIPSPSTKLCSTFTIDSILSDKKHENSSILLPPNSSGPDRNSNDESSNEKVLYNWLRCTRYKPPKVKKRINSGGKRKPVNRGPRIPFTSCQISELETKFGETHYLSSLEVTYLAQKLNLTDSRIRIWFQNRRAREKREEREDRELAESHMTNVNTNYLMESLDKRKTAPVASHETTSTIESVAKES